MYTLWILPLLVLFSCTREHQTTYAATHSIRKPLVTILSVEDQVHSSQSMLAAQSFSQSIMDRLGQKNILSLSTSPKKPQQFLVKMKLIQHDEISKEPLELNMGIHLEILDLRLDTPRVILQEVISAQTLLPGPLKNLTISWHDETFRISSIGLAQAKLSREISTRIEDYISLATKG